LKRKDLILYFAPILPTSIKLQSNCNQRSFRFPIAPRSSTIEDFYPPSFMITLRATWSLISCRTKALELRSR